MLPMAEASLSGNFAAWEDDKVMFGKTPAEGSLLGVLGRRVALGCWGNPLMSC